MITLKLLEIRDRATFIPAFAFTSVSQEVIDPGVDPSYPQETWLLRRSGFATDDKGIFLGKLGDTETHADPYLWKNERTMTTAHLFIRDHWDEIQSGDVIDVEFILKETKTKKLSERIQ